MAETVDELIHKELEQQDTSKLHHSIPEVPKFAHSQVPETVPDDFSFGGIDLSKYSELTPSALAISTIYTLLKKASLPIAQSVNSRLWERLNDEIQESVDELENEVKKRTLEIEATASKRRRVVEDNKETLKYLEERRTKALSNVVDIKAEVIKLTLENQRT